MEYDREKIRERIITKGIYSREKNLQIYEQYYFQSPRYLFRAVDGKFGISRKVLCDIGCSFGENLLYCQEDSYGIEINQEKVHFARSVGLNVFHRDLEQDDISDLPKVEAIWCSAVLEHVASPHLFLRKLYFLLQARGILALYVPIVPYWSFLEYLPRIGQYVSGYKRDEHINAFVPATLQFTCERAGFKTLNMSAMYPGIFRFLNYIPFANRFIGRCVYVGKRIEGFYSQ